MRVNFLMCEFNASWETWYFVSKAEKDDFSGPEILHEISKKQREVKISYFQQACKKCRRCWVKVPSRFENTVQPWSLRRSIFRWNLPRSWDFKSFLSEQQKILKIYLKCLYFGWFILVCGSLVVVYLLDNETFIFLIMKNPYLERRMGVSMHSSEVISEAVASSFPSKPLCHLSDLYLKTSRLKRTRNTLGVKNVWGPLDSCSLSQFFSFL